MTYYLWGLNRRLAFDRCQLYRSGALIDTSDTYSLLTVPIRRWRLRKAFYSKESLVTRGWLERFQEVFCPLWTGLKKRKRKRQYREHEADILRDHDRRNIDPFVEETEPTEKRSLNLADLRGMEPEYISNITVHNWKKDANFDRDHDLLTIVTYHNRAFRSRSFDC